MNPDLKLKIQKVTKIISDTRIFFFSILWLCFLVIAGTLAQGNMGLYQAQEIYFSSFVLWLMWIPLPGGYTVMSIIFIGLLFKLVFHTEWRNAKHLGIIIAHLGALLLLFGGFLTAVFSTEGNMVIPEGDKLAFISDYYSNELAIVDTSPAEHDAVLAFQEGWLKKDKLLETSALPFTIQIMDYYTNCRPIQRKSEAPDNFIGLAKNFDIIQAELSKEVSANRAGVKFQVISKKDAQTQNYLVLENMPVTQTIQFEDKTFRVELRKEQRPLPFEIELLDFIKEDHPGTSMASSYSSEINLIQDGIKQRVLISMNHPLRQDGYTFYQSSFMQSNDSETTVLAVVDNVGRLFPYISSLIMCIGLLIHMLIKMPVLFKTEPQNNKD